MNYDLADYAMQMSPQERQMMTAELLRAKMRSAQQQQLAQANQQGHAMDNMAAMAPMMNNPGMVTGATTAAKNMQSQYKPTQMGQQGFMLPQSGEFVESPMYVDEKNAAREATAENTQSRLAQAMQMHRDRLQAKEEADARHAELAREMAAGRYSLATTIAGMKADADGGKKEIKLGQDADRQVQKYTAALEKAGVPDFEAALRIAEGRMANHKEGELPGFGRWASLPPSGMSSDEVQMSRADMQMAADILLKSRSGAAVTNQEMYRFLTEVSMGRLMTEKALRHGWKNVRNVFDQKRRNLTTSMKPELHDLYVDERGGTDYRMPDQIPVKPRPGDKYLGN